MKASVNLSCHRMTSGASGLQLFLLHCYVTKAQLPGEPPACCGCSPANTSTCWTSVPQANMAWPSTITLLQHTMFLPMHDHQEGLYIPKASLHIGQIFKIPGEDREEGTVTVLSLGHQACGRGLYWVKCLTPPLSSSKSLN